MPRGIQAFVKAPPGEMTRDEFNRRLQEVQEIEAQCGFQILSPYRYYDPKTHELLEAGYGTKRGTVFRQVRPFKKDCEYFVDEGLYRCIVYSDHTR